jgi:hypothetical protein
MRKLLAVAFLVLAGLVALSEQSHRAEADAICYQIAAPTPIPTTGRPNLGICDSTGHLLTSSSGGSTPGPTPTPVPTPSAIATTLASSATSVTLLGAGVATNGVAFCNNSTQIAYLSLVTPATSASMITALSPEVSGIPFCFIQSNSDLYHGAWYAIWVSANGTMTVTYW